MHVSTVGQSLDAQLIQLEKAGAEKIFQEKISGVKKDRPELQAMLDYIREGDTVIVSKLIVLQGAPSTFLISLIAFQEKKVTFSVLNINLDTSTPTGKLMLTMLGAS